MRNHILIKKGGNYIMCLSRIKKYVKENYLLVLLFVIAAIIETALVFPLMYWDSINYDSAYQYALTQHTISEIWELLPYDYSPPFYAIALKLYTMIFGSSLIVMRTFSIIAVVGMLFISVFPVNSLFGRNTALWSLFITFTSSFIFNMIHEVRPTIFAMFFFMGASVYAAAAYAHEKKHEYVCMTVFSVLAMYTHNVALVGAFGMYVVLLAFALISKNYKKFKHFLISGIICAVLYLPWLSVILKQITSVNDHFWTADVEAVETLNWILLGNFSQSLFKVSVPMLLGFLLFFALLKHIKIKELKTAAHFKDIFKPCAEKEEYRNILLMIMIIAAPCIILAVVNAFLRNLASYRYYGILAVAWITPLSAMLARFGNKVCCTLLALCIVISSTYDIYDLTDELRTSNIFDIVSDMEQIESDDEIVFLHLHEWSVGTMAYYFPNAKHYICDRTFTVLQTYDVFPVEVVDIGDWQNIWNYADKVYIYIPVMDDLTEDNEDIFSEAEFITDYDLAYRVSRKQCELYELTKDVEPLDDMN